MSQLSSVTTLYDTAFSSDGGFQALSTYSIPGATTANTLNCVILDLADGGLFFADGGGTTYTNAICSTVITELNALGYTLIDPATDAGGAEPSFVVTIAASNQAYTAWYTYPWYGYWGGYYPYYPWGGWGYYYPCCTYYYSYNVGTLVITMVKPTASSALPDGGAIDAVWGAALNGVLSTYTTPQSVSAGITQAFDQSPYLGTAP